MILCSRHQSSRLRYFFLASLNKNSKKPERLLRNYFQEMFSTLGDLFFSTTINGIQKKHLRVQTQKFGYTHPGETNIGNKIQSKYPSQRLHSLEVALSQKI